jgi:chromosome partitioning protein
MIISICNEKGGSGKTNIAINLAIAFGLKECETLLIDADPQRSVEVFTNIRANEDLPLIFNSVAKFGAGLAREALNFKKKYDVVIIDTGGRDSEEMRQALAISDLVIIPTIPSDVDIVVLNKMLKLYAQAKAFNPNSNALIVISKASPNPFLTKKVEALRDYINEKDLEDIALLDTILYEREAYRNAFTNGKGIIEFSDSKENSYKDFNNFFNEIVNYINNKE